MSRLGDKTLEQLNSDDVESLVDDEQPEDDEIDFKKEGYTEHPSALAEAAKDLSGLANASGGHILLGIDERKRDGVSIASCISGITDPDVQAQRLESVARSWVEPPIGWVRSKPVVTSKGTVLIVRVGPSPSQPHMLKHAQISQGSVDPKIKWPFWIRRGSNTMEMTLSELRQSFERAFGLEDRFSRYLMGRREKWSSWPSKRFFIVSATPMPFGQRIHPAKVEEAFWHLSDELGIVSQSESGRVRPSLWGLIADVPGGRWPRLEFVEDVGHLEFVDDEDDRQKPLDAHLLRRRLEAFFEGASSIYGAAGFEGSCAAQVSVLHAHALRISLPESTKTIYFDASCPRNFFEPYQLALQSEFIDDGDLISPLLRWNIGQEPHKVISAALDDLVWRAFGAPKSLFTAIEERNEKRNQ